MMSERFEKTADFSNRLLLGVLQGTAAGIVIVLGRFAERQEWEWVPLAYAIVALTVGSQTIKHSTASLTWNARRGALGGGIVGAILFGVSSFVTVPLPWPVPYFAVELDSKAQEMLLFITFWIPAAAGFYAVIGAMLGTIGAIAVSPLWIDGSERELLAAELRLAWRWAVIVGVAKIALVTYFHFASPARDGTLLQALSEELPALLYLAVLFVTIRVFIGQIAWWR